MRIAGSEHRLPRGRICVAEKLYPPLWMLIFGLQLALESGFDRGALAQKSAQQRVHIPLCRPSLEQAGGLHRLVDDGVLGVAPRFERIQRTPKQCFDQSIRAATARQARYDGLHPAIAAQRTVREINQRGARLADAPVTRRRELLGKTVSRRYSTYDARGLGELNRQRGGMLQSKRSPRASCRPRRKSAAGMRRPPAGCNSSMASASVPQAT